MTDRPDISPSADSIFGDDPLSTAVTSRGTPLDSLLRQAGFSQLASGSPAEDIADCLRRLRGLAEKAGLDSLELATLKRAVEDEFGEKQIKRSSALVRQAFAKENRTERAGKENDFDEVEASAEAVDGAALLSDLAACVLRHVTCSDQAANAVALWIMFAWLIDIAEFAPLLVITAPEKRCGKTLLLELVGKLVPKPLPASNVSPAALFRSVEAWHPTLLIDEADACLRANEELRGILNSGHSRASAFVLRCVGDDLTPTRFPTFGARVISGIGRPHETLVDRSIVIELRRKLPTESIETMRGRGAEFAILRGKAKRWALDHAGAVGAVSPEFPCSLNDRERNNWDLLLRIAAVAGGVWPSLAWAAAQDCSRVASGDEGQGAELLRQIRDAFRDCRASEISSADLCAFLNGLPEGRWADFAGGRGLSQGKLARLLKGFGIRPRKVRPRLGKPTNCYVKSDFADAFGRYLSSDPEQSEQSEQSSADAADGAGPRSETAPAEGATQAQEVPATVPTVPIVPVSGDSNDRLFF